MSDLPLSLKAHIWPMRATAQEDKVLAKVAAADWRKFLACRAEELVPGGQLVMVIGAADETSASGLEPMMDQANTVLETLVAEGRLQADAYTAMTIPARPRRLKEFLAPFEAGELPDLKLEEVVIAQTPNAAMLRWQESSDATLFAADITGFFIAAFGPALFGENEELRGLFSSRFTAATALAPAEVAQPLITATLRIVRHETLPN